MKKAQISGIATCFAGLLSGGATPASFAGPWSSPSGTAADFTYANGGDLNGHFGEPVISGNSFFFPQLSLAAIAAEGSTDFVEDVVSFDIHANPGLSFGFMGVTPFGTYSVSGDTLNNSATLDASLSLDENGSPNRYWEGEVTTSPNMPVNSGAGGWSGLVTIDPTLVGFEGATSLHVEFGMTMMAISGPSGTAEIRFLPGADGFDLSFNFVPEPSSLSIFAMGAFLLGMHKRQQN